MFCPKCAVRMNIVSKPHTHGLRAHCPKCWFRYDWRLK